MEGVQGVVDCGTLGVGVGVRGHDVFTHTHTHTHTYICTLMVLHRFRRTLYMWHMMKIWTV